MKITFTGISKEEAIKRLEAAAIEGRAFADRIKAMHDERFAGAIRSEESKAHKYDKLAQLIRDAEGDSVSIDEKDEGMLRMGLAQGERTFYDADTMYTITPESISEMPFEMMLSLGEQEANKTERM